MTGAERAPHGGGRRLTIRWATPDDADALARLALLDSSRPPRGVVLLAEVGDELWAAISLDDGHLIADPFRLSGELAFDLAQRARRVKRAERGRMGRLPAGLPDGRRRIRRDLLTQAPTSASARVGLPVPPASFSGATITTAPTGGSSARLASCVRPYLPAPRTK